MVSRVNSNYLSQKLFFKRYAYLAIPIIVCIMVAQLVPAVASPTAKRYNTITSLKTAFVNAGGQCWEWKIDSYVTKTLGGREIYADCDKYTRIVFYKDDANVLKDALNSAKHSRSLGLKINILVGPNWMINSDQVKLVYKKLGGTLITR